MTYLGLATQMTYLVLLQGSYGSGKSQGEIIFLKVREKSGNFVKKSQGVFTF